MPREDKEQEEEQKARTAYDLIRMRLERLQKNIEKPVSIPQRRDGRKPRPPPDFVRNVVGSSAAAGSAEFHIFRNNRKREMDRLDYMNQKSLQEELDAKFLAEKARRLEEEEKATAKKRLKRQRYKDKLKRLRKQKDRAKDSSEKDEDSSFEEENAMEERKEDVNEGNEELRKKDEDAERSFELEKEIAKGEMQIREVNDLRLQSRHASEESMTPAGTLLSLVRGPRVYAYVRERDSAFPSNSFEYVGETMLTVIRGCRSICTVVSPILLLIAYNKSLLSGINFMMLAKFTVTYYMIAMSTRTVGRMFNPEYRRFTDTLLEAHDRKGNTITALARLRSYDYEVFAAPIDFQAQREHRKFFKSPSKFANEGNLLYTIFRDCLAFNVVFSFARMLIYPGSVSLLNTLIHSFLVENRRKLMGGIRALLMTIEGNHVDTMFVDRRGKEVNGEILVITCEGNAGFYETGIMVTPIALNYSVLGWNQPGFGESSGLPIPKQTTSSIDAVMQYAIHKLGFMENQIVIYAWSIGGFPATWAAANYPNIKALILDATFDDLLPLAEAKMPKSWAPLVEFIIRTYFDLPVALQLSSYPGPIVIIRRRQDEMVITEEIDSDEGRLATNRANVLLKALIRSRHPKILNDNTERLIDFWLAASPLERISMSKVAPHMFAAIDNFDTLPEEERNTLVYCLCSKYLIDFDSSHNTPLDPLLFSIPTPL